MNHEVGAGPESAESGLRIVKLPVGELRANAYVVSAGNAAVVIDPGGDADDIAAEVARHGCRLEAVWLTHAHFDHVGGLQRLLDIAKVPHHLHPADGPLLKAAVEAAARWGYDIDAPPLDFTPLAASQQLTVGPHTARVLHVPGHSPGSVAFHFPGVRKIFSGDVLFHGSVGRTDVPFGDHAVLLASIFEQLLTLDDDTLVLPGHGPNTTIGVERRENPFLAG